MGESGEGSIGKRDCFVKATIIANGALFIANGNNSSFLNLTVLRGRQRKEEAVFYY